MTFDLLWTDKCFLTLLMLSALLILFSLRKEPIRRSFSLIVHRPLAVSAGIVLMFFLAIGVLDSLHYKKNINGIESTTSVLDTLLAPIGSVYEKTYSAPLALNTYTMETQLRDGVAQQVYPRLKYPPKTIKNNEEKNHLIKSIVRDSLRHSLIISALLTISAMGLSWFQNRKRSHPLSVTAFTALLTVAILLFLSLSAYYLSRSFHVLGTGQIGQDILYATVKSIRTGWIIGLLTTLFMLPLALFLGVAAGYFGGFVDDVIQYIYTTLSSIPGVLLITASVLSLQTYITNHPEQFTTLEQSADARLFALCLILGVTSWTSLCRLLRAEVLKLREVDYVVAAKALGSNWFTIIRKHLVPNVMHIVIITLVLDFSFLVLAEAVLSYVGVGVSPLTMSWGNMINGARLELARDPIVWWPMFSAFLLMFFLVLAVNLFADAVRDAFDPHLM